MKHFQLFFVILLLCGSAYAQQDSSEYTTASEKVEVLTASPTPTASISEISNTPPTTKDGGAPQIMSIMTSYEVWLSFGVLTFGLIVMVIELYLMNVNKFDQNQTIKFILVTLIITSALFLITAGFSNNQIAPAMGLLGTVAGYLLGKGDTAPTNDTTKK